MDQSINLRLEALNRTAPANSIRCGNGGQYVHHPLHSLHVHFESTAAVRVRALLCVALRDCAHPLYVVLKHHLCTNGNRRLGVCRRKDQRRLAGLSSTGRLPRDVEQKTIRQHRCRVSEECRTAQTSPSSSVGACWEGSLVSNAALAVSSQGPVAPARDVSQDNRLETLQRTT